MNTPSWLVALTDPRVALRDPFSLLDPPFLDMPPVAQPVGMRLTLVCCLLLVTTALGLAVTPLPPAVEQADGPPAAERALGDGSGLREIMLGDLFARGVGTRPDADRAAQHYAAAMRAGNREVRPHIREAAGLDPVAAGPVR